MRGHKTRFPKTRDEVTKELVEELLDYDPKTGKFMWKPRPAGNGDRAVNRIENLRMATRSQNCMNRRKPSHNKSGHKGVVWYPRNKKWGGYVDVKTEGKRRRTFVGIFSNIQDARAAVNKKRAELHGEFARQD